ncbi:MAG TPA: glycolate oxidase subunit GlcE [Stellaceae bacterium]|nr:glycolate oxidase subunit GlcE [Stellaceae bacterium]
MTTFRPSDERELSDIVAAALAREEPLEIVAGGSKRGLGRPLQLPHTLDMSAFSGIRSYEPEELVLTAGAATSMRIIEAALAERGQMLAFEPPDWRRLLGSGAAEPTLGGVTACNLSGPRRIKAGAARDHLLGFHAVSGRAEAFKAGGRVVKNVTGYDLPKLMAGSYGTLAALTEVTFKVLPRPEAERSLVVAGLDDAAATRAMAAALNSPHEVSGAAHLPRGADGADRPLTVLRLEGPAPSVAARAAALAQELGSFGTIDEAREGASRELWQAVGEVVPLAHDAQRTLWRLSVAPNAGAPLAAELARRLDHRHFFDWGGGLLWLAVRGGDDGGAAIIRAAIARLGGHATLIRGADALRAAVPVFQPQAPALAALSRRVKEGFDPRRILNRGRIYADL